MIHQEKICQMVMLSLSAEFGEAQQASRPSAQTDRSQTAGGQRIAERSRRETQERERIREFKQTAVMRAVFDKSAA